MFQALEIQLLNLTRFPLFGANILMGVIEKKPHTNQVNK